MTKRYHNCTTLHTFNLIMGYRSTVMMLLAVMDPVGSLKRKTRRLNRRIYSNKVGKNITNSDDDMKFLQIASYNVHSK